MSSKEDEKESKIKSEISEKDWNDLEEHWAKDYEETHVKKQ